MLYCEQMSYYAMPSRDFCSLKAANSPLLYIPSPLTETALFHGGEDQLDNSQLLKGILEGCVLGIIEKGETYGYEILDMLQQAGFSDIGEGTLYPVLSRLDKNGDIACRKARSPLGPVRKYYSITESGKRSYADFLARYKYIAQCTERLLGESMNKTEGQI